MNRLSLLLAFAAAIGARNPTPAFRSSTLLVT